MMTHAPGSGFLTAAEAAAARRALGIRLPEDDDDADTTTDDDWTPPHGLPRPLHLVLPRHPAGV